MKWRHLLLAGIAMLAAAEANAADQPGRTNGAPVDLLPLITVNTPRQNGHAPAIGGYVRFYVYDPTQTGELPSVNRDQRQYIYEHRNWLSRWLIGRSFSRLLTLKLSISRPNISATTTLAASVLQSNRSVGETWSSEVNGTHYLTPYLRVDPDTLASVEVNMNAATAVQANITRAVLDVVSRAVTLVQPTAQIVTTLNAERFRQTSEFVDQSVSTLFAQNLVESTSNDFGPGAWTGEPLVDISAMFPMNRRLLQDQHYANVGQWRVAATPARVSMFSDIELAESANQTGRPECGTSAAGQDRQACRAFVGLTPQRVLGLEVGDDQALGEVLLADAAIAAELPRLAGAPNGAQDAARRLCALVAAKAEELGLNRYDAAASVWAFGQGSNIERERREMLMNDSRSCPAASLAKSVGLS